MNDRVESARAQVEPLLKRLCRSKGLPYPLPRMFLRAIKKEHKLEVWGAKSGRSRYVLLKTYGLQGAAVAGVLRVAIGGATYHFFSGRMLNVTLSEHLKALLPFGAAIALLLAFHLPMLPLVKAFVTVVAALVYLWLAWFYILEKQDKHFILKRIGKAAP